MACTAGAGGSGVAIGAVAGATGVPAGRPGGTFVLVDSLQFGDRPGWDGLLEAFPVRFHEPYYRHFLIDDLDGTLTASGLDRIEDRLAFLSKVMVRRKAD